MRKRWRAATAPFPPPKSGGVCFDGTHGDSLHANGANDLEPIEPSVAHEMYLDHEAYHCVETTVNSHRYSTNYSVQWCEERGIDDSNDLPGRAIQQFRLWQEGVGELNRVSLQTRLCTSRVFLQHCASIDAVDVVPPENISLPTVNAGENQREDGLPPDRTQASLGHLSKYRYASREHVLVALLWETGMRIGGANSLDVSGVVFDERSLEMRPGPKKGRR